MPFDYTPDHDGGGGEDPRHEGVRENAVLVVTQALTAAIDADKCTTCFLTDIAAVAIKLIPAGVETRLDGQKLSEEQVEELSDLALKKVQEKMDAFAIGLERIDPEDERRDE